MSGIVQNNILRTSGSIAVAAAGLNWSSTILTALTTFTVTVGNPGAGNRYYIDTVLQATVNLLEGFTYKFDQSDSSNSGHPLRFSTTSGGSHSGGSEYTTGVTTNGTPGSSGAYTQIVVASGAPVLYYYCTAHSGMGGTANTTAETVEAGNGYWIDTTSTTCTITLPSAAEKGDQIILVDYARTWGTNKITINSNGLNYQGNADTYTLEYSTDGEVLNIIYSDATKGWIPQDDDEVADAPSSPPTQQGIMAFGEGSGANESNKVSSSGVIASSVTGVGTERYSLASATYGDDKGMFFYGRIGSTFSNSITNLVSNSGVIASNSSAAGTARGYCSGVSFGSTGQAIVAFGNGGSGGGGYTNDYNIISNQAVIASNTSGSGTARTGAACAPYGGDKAMYAYGYASGGPYLNSKALVSNSGVVASNTTGAGTARVYLGGAGYTGRQRGIIFGGDNGSMLGMTNLISDTGVLGSDVSATGTARYGTYSCSFGGDQAIFAYGYTSASGNVSMSNKVNSSGVMASDVTGVGSTRANGAGLGFSTSA
jgi:hypothetical protein